jgi:hypothetical protein
VQNVDLHHLGESQSKISYSVRENHLFDRCSLAASNFSIWNRYFGICNLIYSRCRMRIKNAASSISFSPSVVSKPCFATHFLLQSSLTVRLCCAAYVCRNNGRATGWMDLWVPCYCTLKIGYLSTGFPSAYV